MLPSALKSDLEKRLAHASRIAVIGIGSELGDDSGHAHRAQASPLAYRSKSRSVCFSVLLQKASRKYVSLVRRISLSRRSGHRQIPGEVEFIDPNRSTARRFPRT